MHSIPIAEDDAPPSLTDPALDLSADLRGNIVAGRFELAELYFHGEAGSVYLARDTHSGRPVEVKILAPEAATSAAVDRFRERSRRMLGLSHPSLAAVHGEGIAENGLPFAVMEHRGGRNLHHMLGDPRLAWPGPEAIVRQLAEALAALHAVGVVHGNISFLNVVWFEDDVGPPRVQLVDREFRVADEPGAAPREPTVSDDLQALGAVVYELCTGRAVDETPGQSPSMRAADAQISVPAPFEALILSLLERDPAARPGNALAVLDQLDRATAAPGIGGDDLDFLNAISEPHPAAGRFVTHPESLDPRPEPFAPRAPSAPIAAPRTPSGPLFVPAIPSAPPSASAVPQTHSGPISLPRAPSSPYAASDRPPAASASDASADEGHDSTDLTRDADPPDLARAAAAHAIDPFGLYRSERPAEPHTRDRSDLPRDFSDPAERPDHNNLGEQPDHNNLGERPDHNNLGDDRTRDNLADDRTPDNLADDRTPDNLADDRTPDNLGEPSDRTRHDLGNRLARYPSDRSPTAGDAPTASTLAARAPGVPAHDPLDAIVAELGAKQAPQGPEPGARPDGATLLESTPEPRVAVATPRPPAPTPGSARTIAIVASVLLLLVILWRTCDATPPPAPPVTMRPAPTAAPSVERPPTVDPPTAPTPTVAPAVDPTAVIPTAVTPTVTPTAVTPTTVAATPTPPPPIDSTATTLARGVEPPPTADPPEPAVVPPTGDLPEQLSAGEFRRLMLRSNRSEAVRTCYRRHARPGEEDVEFVAIVNPAGRVQKPRLTPAIPLADCLKRVVTKLEFPAAARPAQYSFIFHSPGADGP